MPKVTKKRIANIMAAALDSRTDWSVGVGSQGISIIVADGTPERQAFVVQVTEVSHLAVKHPIQKP